VTSKRTKHRVNGEEHPSVVVLAGPNGAGKTTASSRFLRGALGVEEYVNADVIAQGLSGFNPDQVAFEAGELMLRRLRALAERRLNFAFETTLASRSLAPWIKELQSNGYEFHLLFLWLPSADAAVARVAARVRLGGHNVPEETIRRRYERGLSNFFHRYQPMATTWQLLDNSQSKRPRLIARGEGPDAKRIANKGMWDRIRQGYGQ
jgi:predicted ABC-type ATPase